MTDTESLPGPAYKILTSRLVMRCLEPRDIHMWATAIEQSVKHLLPWVPWAKQEPLSLEDRIELLRSWRGNFDLGSSYEFGLFDPLENVLLGGAGLYARIGKDALEIGYWIHKDHLHQGLATEAAAALTKVAFEIEHVNRVEIHCDPKNVRSAAIPKKLGFIHEATLHNRFLDSEGKLRDSMIWSLFKEYYPSSLAKITKIQAYDFIGRRIL
jgi:RimJ/RimL family protein N-acetyltransferase